MNYDRLELVESELDEFRSLVAHYPYRDWYAVKAEHQEARFFDSKRKATNYCKTVTHYKVYKAARG